ncbi:MAG TPA: ATP-binding protein [Candidatus Dormibacteraeota bacterium]|nr:ATP-binding protein [Candidatus Dormibacteraeota bacterium]
MTTAASNRRVHSRRFEDELLQWLGSGSGEILSVVDSKGDLSYVSRAAQRLLGWSPEELLGKPAASLYHPEDLELLGLGGESTDRRHAPRIRCLHRDGSWREVETQVRPIIPINQDDGVAVVVLTRHASREAEALQDLRRDNARLRRAARRTEVLLDQLPVGVLQLSSQGRIERVNSWTADFLGRPEEDLHGRVFPGLLAELSIGDLEPVDVEDSDPQTGPSLSSDGRSAVTTSHRRIAPFDDEDLETVAVVLVPAGAPVAGGNDLQQAKTEFLRTISHELRTPLTSILGFSDLLATRPSLTDSEELAAIQGSAEVLLEKVDDLLLLASLREGQVSMTPAGVDLIPIAKKVIDDHRVEADKKAVRLIIDMPPTMEVLGSAPFLSDIIRHLVRNAITFTRGGHVTLSVQPAVEYVRVAVADTGPGVGAFDEEWLFDDFTQADQSTSRRYGGMGIGLGLVKHLVELHRGVCGVENRDEGATFWFTVPRRPIAIGAGPRGADG